MIRLGIKHNILDVRKEGERLLFQRNFGVHHLRRIGICSFVRLDTLNYVNDTYQKT